MNFFAWIADDEIPSVGSVRGVRTEPFPREAATLPESHPLTPALTPSVREPESAKVVSLFGNDRSLHLSHISHPVRQIFQQTQLKAALRRVADIYSPGDLEKMTENEINQVIEINDQLEAALLNENQDLIEALATWECRWRTLLLRKRQEGTP